MLAWPAFVITAIGVAPAAASRVMAVWRRSWNGLSFFWTPAAGKAASSCSLNFSGSK